MNAMVGALSFEAAQSVVTPLFPAVALEGGLTGIDAAAPISPSLATLRVQPVADPFARLHDRVMELQDAINNGDGSEEEKDNMMDEWANIDAEALASQPNTLAGALGALQRARYEFVQFQMNGSEISEDPSRQLLLHLINGAVGVLRQTVKEAA